MRIKVLLAAISLFLFTGTVSADKLDDVIDAGVLRCGVVLDFPPIGFWDEIMNQLALMLNTVKTSRQLWKLTTKFRH